jgi:hypothetical protein
VWQVRRWPQGKGDSGFLTASPRFPRIIGDRPLVREILDFPYAGLLNGLRGRSRRFGYCNPDCMTHPDLATGSKYDCLASPHHFSTYESAIPGLVPQMRCSQCGNKAAETVAVARPRQRGCPEQRLLCHVRAMDFPTRASRSAPPPPYGGPDDLAASVHKGRRLFHAVPGCLLWLQGPPREVVVILTRA